MRRFVGRVLFFRLRSRNLVASFGETRRSAKGAKAVGPGVMLLLALLLISIGCTGSNEAQNAQPAQSVPATTSGSVSIDFRSEPDPPKAGDNSIEVTVKRPDGSPVTDATVTAVFSMPAMPSMNMPAMRTSATLAHEAAGRYRGAGQLTMSGTWNVNVTVSRGAEELGRKNFSLVAK